MYRVTWIVMRDSRLLDQLLSEVKWFSCTMNHLTHAGWGWVGGWGLWFFSANYIFISKTKHPCGSDFLPHWAFYPIRFLTSVARTNIFSYHLLNKLFTEKNSPRIANGRPLTLSLVTNVLCSCIVFFQISFSTLISHFSATLPDGNVG